MPFALRAAVRLAHLRRFINRAVIARPEREAVRADLHRLDDRRLADTGICRGQIESSLEAARGCSSRGGIERAVCLDGYGSSAADSAFLLNL
jgi:uncharacterized protein YjiS (DUF1127 family)